MILAAVLALTFAIFGAGILVGYPLGRDDGRSEQFDDELNEALAIRDALGQVIRPRSGR